MFNMIVFGPPGCGKGTQSAKIISDFGFLHLSTGDIIRKEIEKNTEVGKFMLERISKGHLIPNEMILKEVFDFFTENKNAAGVVFDGFPRTVCQAEELDSFLKSQNSAIHLIVAIDVPDNELIDRVESRGKTSGRVDDDYETMMQRLNVYREHTQPVFNFYKKHNRLFTVNGDMSIDDVYSQINKLISQTIKEI